MLYLSENSSSYTPEIMQAFRNNKAKDVLNKYLYDYREHTEDESFHFLMGLCMLDLGYYEEAHVAFGRSQKYAPEGSHRGNVFDALVMLMAQHDDEAKAKIEEIPLDGLTASELVTIMSIKNKLNLPVSVELQKVLNSPFQTEADRRVMSIFAFKYGSFDDAASSMARSLDKHLFQDFGTYMYVIEELYKLHMEEEVDYLLGEIDVEEVADSYETFRSYIDTCYSCGYFNRMDESQFPVLYMHSNPKRRTKAARKKWEENQARLYCMEYDRMEKTGDDNRHELMKKMKTVKKKSEQLLLYITAYDFEHFKDNDPAKIKKNIEKLIKMNQTSLRYRKLYCDLLTAMGFVHLADEVTKATIAMRKRTENEEFALVHKFHSFYMPRPCMMKYMPVHEHEDGANCPICFGAGSQPIIRAIGAGHSSSPIFTDNLEKRIIEPNEAMLRDLVNWQPMNVASPIVAKYLLSLGAYMSARDYPDVLVPGQTYLYLSLKPESEKRLLEEGYSKLQIDPFAVAMDIKGSKDNQDGKSLETLPVSSSDFTLEIIHAISPQEDLDHAPEMPVPEQYTPESHS